MRLLVTGLAKGTGYSVDAVARTGGTDVTVATGGDTKTDGGGVLTVTI
jgi:hypothetical protein